MMLTIETDNPDIDVKELMQRVDEKAGQVKKSMMTKSNAFFSVHDLPPEHPESPPQIDLKDQYHINELLGLRGDHFVASAYRAIIQKKPDPEIIARYTVLYYQGILTKKELLCTLRYSPEGRKKGVHIQGLRIPCMIGKIFRIPVLGRFCRIFVCILRLPLLFRNIQRLDNMLIACQDELQVKVNAEEYNRHLKRISMAFQMTEQRTLDLLQELEENHLQ